jgi:hypothetical protein
MKIKWKCVLRNIIIPAIAAIIVISILFGVFWYVVLNVNNVNPVTPLNLTSTNLTQSQNYPYYPDPYYSGSSFGIGPIISIFLLIFVIMLAVGYFREALKPCIIHEQGVADEIANGISAVYDLMCFFISIIMYFTCISCVIFDIYEIYNVIFSYFNHIIAPHHVIAVIGLTIISIICGVTGWLIYPYRKNDE